jgi:hypothetical protein
VVIFTSFLFFFIPIKTKNLVKGKGIFNSELDGDWFFEGNLVNFLLFLCLFVYIFFQKVEGYPTEGIFFNENRNSKKK